MQHSWDQATVLVIGSAVVFWVAGIVLYLGDPSQEAQHAGLVLVILAAVTTALGVVRSWHLRMRRAFVHGYHAGYHDATKRVQPEAAKDCDVLELSEMKARRLTRLG